MAWSATTRLLSDKFKARRRLRLWLRLADWLIRAEKAGWKLGAFVNG
jgi:hypothetical protein